ncbi:DUF2264 domain-containing protein [Sphingomonas sp. MA1305]|uniref:DUF2264 domain-containing protein n=1 Tax=Sphingomonas sp. MA1305 TaxID=2479204 RepID=UPI0018DF481B|nr:DUF2264 domain-containing protein [Sphingomonas sp. MA1305]MBI0477136.1 DUF2264 domain-containing protein [Sphingomonas sp. MA1305]
MSGGLDRRDLLAGLAGGAGLLAAAAPAAAAAQGQGQGALPDGAADRAYALELLRRMAEPVLGRMARGRLQAEWQPELSPTWDGRDRRVAYLEAFGRLVDGLAPWLALPDDTSAEGRLRARLREQAVQSYVHAVDPKSPDYLLWRGPGQALVDSAYFTSALLRAPDALWTPLDAATKARIVTEIKGLRHVSPPYQNWILFAAMNEAFLFSIGEQWDPMRVDLAIRKFLEWYVGDGWYGDGADFHYDYYNSYVIHPMLVQILAVLAAGKPDFNSLKPAEEHARALKRMQRYAEHLERMVGPDGAYAAIGRSLTYRTAVHQPLGFLAWHRQLPDTLPAGQVRAVTSATQRRIFADPSNFNADGFLTIGFARAQPTLGDIYSNAGSMYIASEGLLALGLPADDPYWTAAPQPWTMRRAYAGEDFRKDYYVTY